jgi:hypothetical protein
MSTVSAHTPLAGRRVSAADTRGSYRWLALAAAAIAFVGFARSYYLKDFFGTRALPLALHVHALIMSAWLILFIVQTCLIAAHRITWHRRFGMAAAVLAALVIVTGATLTVLATEREAAAHEVGRFHYLLLINSVNLLLFGAFVGGGFVLRVRADAHKRLMLLGAVTLLAPAAARISLLLARGPLPQFLTFYACIGACVLIDTLRSGRLHPVMGWGAFAVIAAFQLSYFTVQTHQWLSIVHRLFGG